MPARTATQSAQTPKDVAAAPEPPGARLPVRRPAGGGSGARLGLGRGISAVELATCTRRLAMLLRARLPLVRALETLARTNTQAAGQIGRIKAHFLVIKVKNSLFFHP